VLVANIIAHDPLPWFSSLTIDKGAADGVQKNAAVLSPFGVVAIRWQPAHTPAGCCLTDHNSGIDAVVQRSRARGIVRGPWTATVS